MLRIFSDYIKQAMNLAQIERLEDNSFVGRIPVIKGVIAFGANEAECREKLQSTLESWILLSLKLGHTIPVIRGINLNNDPIYE